MYLRRRHTVYEQGYGTAYQRICSCSTSDGQSLAAT